MKQAATRFEPRHVDVEKRVNEEGHIMVGSKIISLADVIAMSATEVFYNPPYDYDDNSIVPEASTWVFYGVTHEEGDELVCSYDYFPLLSHYRTEPENPEKTEERATRLLTENENRKKHIDKRFNKNLNMFLSYQQESKTGPEECFHESEGLCFMEHPFRTEECLGYETCVMYNPSKSKKSRIVQCYLDKKPAINFKTVLNMLRLSVTEAANHRSLSEALVALKESVNKHGYEEHKDMHILLEIIENLIKYDGKKQKEV